MSPFACLSPVKDPQYFLCFIFVQFLIAFLASPIDITGTVTGELWQWRLHDISVAMMAVTDGLMVAKSQSQSYIATDGQSVCLSWCRAHVGHPL
jgi:hypothetical protein